MFLASALAASPAALYLSSTERQAIANDAASKEFPRKYAAKTAARKCIRVLVHSKQRRPRETLMHMWNDGSSRAINFPLLDEDLPTDVVERVDHPRQFFRVKGKDAF
jgi:hypothetical protein